MEDNIGYIASDVARLIRKRFDVAARSIGVTGPQWRVLFTVMRNPGINQGALAETLDVEPITTCRMVDRLEQGGHLERRRDPADRRAWQIFLTPAAEPLLERLSAIGKSVIAEMTNGLDGTEQAQLIKSMQRLRENLIVGVQQGDLQPATQALEAGAQ